MVIGDKPRLGAYAIDGCLFQTRVQKAAGGGVAKVAPGRTSKENKPFRAQFDAASEAWRKQVSHQWASDTSDNYRQTHAGRLRRPLAIINRPPTPLRRQLRPVGLLPCRKDVGLFMHRGFAAWCCADQVMHTRRVPHYSSSATPSGDW